MERQKNKRMENLLELHNKTPVWNDGIINFILMSYHMKQCSYGSWKTSKVMEFKNFIFRDWKVMEFYGRSWKVMNGKLK